VNPRRAPLLALGFASLLLALAGGLARLGWSAVPAPAAAIALHGPLMIVGFLGTLIGVERAVGARARWAFAAPLGTGVGALGAAASGGAAGARLVAVAGALALLAVLTLGWRGPRTPGSGLQALGAAAFAVGTALWAAGAPVPDALPWWSAFLVLVIAGERLELSRVLAPSRRARAALSALAALLLLAALAAGFAPDPAARASGLAELAIAAWLARFDLARRSIRRPGLARFMAIALLSGQAWLGAAGLLGLAFGAVAAGPGYDAVLHALFLGFVFSMIFAHAPVIFPAVLGLPVAFHRSRYAHLALLHAGLLLRVAGDLAASEPARRWGGLLNALAILLFLAQTAASLGRRRPAAGV
jgi:hypothetical protein